MQLIIMPNGDINRHKTAKALVADYCETNEIWDDEELPVLPEDFYVVWFCKTLQNWKALVSTDAFEGQYFEVTYNGDKNEAYLDHYKKVKNVPYILE